MNRIEREKIVVGWMIDIWSSHHKEIPDIQSQADLLKKYTSDRLDHCKFGQEKTYCQHCPIHCYNQQMREKIREVMRYSGPRMIFYHPIAAIRHLIGKI